MDSNQKTLPRLAATGAIVAGLAAGSYGIASAASGSGTATPTTTTTTTTTPPTTAAPPAGHGFGAPRSDETALTGDTLAKVTAAAKAKLPGATIDRVETDADGHAAYEAHVTQADGTPATVYVDASFDVVSVETGVPGGPGDPHGLHGGPRRDETALTGDALAKVTAAAKAKLPGATIDRVETDADGHAAYEAHVTQADGTPATVYVDSSFNVVSVETR